MLDPAPVPAPLDPPDPAAWAELRRQAHAILDDLIDHVAARADGPVWRELPAALRASFAEPLPHGPTPLAEVYADFRRRILPYDSGNTHPRFVGWVQGGGTPVGMLAELCAAAMNVNAGGRDHAAIEVERQITRWTAAALGFPASASGVLVTGTSLANLLAVVIARTAALGADSRARGVADHRLRAYTSTAAHGCVARAFELAGLGRDALVRLPTGPDHRLDPAAVAAHVAADRARGLQPFLIVASAGTVDIGAIDPLAELAELAAAERLWLHVDGAFGAFAALSPALAPRVAGLGRADSVACDFHKWLQVPYDAGFLLVRSAAHHAAAFASEPAYLARATRGLAGNPPWPTDFGPDLSRGFRALKVWFTLKTYGVDHLGAVIAHTCALARGLADRVAAEPALELLAPVGLCVVCFRYRHPDADRVNAEIVAALADAGVAAPSTTRIDGRLAIRVAIINHRCRAADLDRIVDEILARGAAAPRGDRPAERAP